MLLGKRQRQSMRRTTSLTELSCNDLPVLEPHSQSPDPHSPMQMVMELPAQTPVHSPVVRPQPQVNQQNEKGFQANQYSSSSDDWLGSGLFPPAAPWRSRRSSGDFGADPAQFLRACGLCRRRLGPGRDTYMYRGEIAFCSMECRQQQMALDDCKNKCSLASLTANSSAVQATAAGGTKATPATTAAGGTAAAA